MSSIVAMFDGLGISQLINFHFLRPWWLLSIIPMFLFYRSMVAKDDVLQQWRGHMSSKIIEHLSLRQQQTRKVTPKNLFALF